MYQWFSLLFDQMCVLKEDVNAKLLQIVYDISPLKLCTNTSGI